MRKTCPLSGLRVKSLQAFSSVPLRWATSQHITALRPPPSRLSCCYNDPFLPAELSKCQGPGMERNTWRALIPPRGFRRPVSAGVLEAASSFLKKKVNACCQRDQVFHKVLALEGGAGRLRHVSMSPVPSSTQARGT